MSRCLLLPVALLALLCGCAAQRIKPVDYAPSAESSVLLAAVEDYNRAEGYFRLLGTVKVGGRSFELGARGAKGFGARVDALAGPAAKLIFSAACEEQSGCKVFFPDEFMVYRDNGRRMADWFSSLVAGRIPLIGEPADSGPTADGGGVLRFTASNGQWQLVVLAPGNRLPERVLFGDEGGKASLEIKYYDFLKVDGVSFPRRLVIGGMREGEELELDFTRVEHREEVPAGLFTLKTPPGADESANSGRAAWKKLGMFWTPKD